MPKKLQHSDDVNTVINQLTNTAKRMRHEFFMPEHMLLAMLAQMPFRKALSYSGGNPTALESEVRDFLASQEQVPEEVEYEMSPSTQLDQLLGLAYQYVINSSAKQLDVPHLVMAMLQLPNSQAAYLLTKAVNHDVQGFLSNVISEYGGSDDYIVEDDETPDEEQALPGEATEEADKTWRSQVVCLNDLVAQHNPLIGREAELERTIQVLCRKEKNNPLHVGESGVGKTALVYGLVQRIVEGKVPERLKDSHIYQLDLGSLLAGTQFRGDFEKRVKLIMEGARKEGNAIVYIDEIHNLVGAGRTSDGSMDASNMLKPYLEGGDIRFIGATTYDEYNRFFSKSKGIVRRFQQIDIDEPSVDETIRILQGLKAKYEEFHHVTYPDEVIEYAVRASAKYVNDRFLPDKAIDLIDEAGAYRELHPAEDGSTVVDKQLVSDVLAKVCKVDAMAMKEDDNEHLETLRARMEASIYGQDEAVRQVVEAVQMSKAGLLDDEKPLASLLFVGPTGVGKTEVARVLARELGIALVRFDMSEYTEKHTVAKLIGSPAGYVGYEDGGLLTDAIRKTPNCVLLLDEIEKAHSDIYNILLQVMDYARLTDNKGRKADFRNVILIMTSNAGAQFAAQANIGFTGNVSRGEAMLKQVKKTFKPEFINRLTGTVVFNDMDREMATLILKKKLGELQEKLTAKQVEMTLSDDAFALLLDEGFTREYGAREMDRVIAQRLKPLLMREILFGSLKNGGKVTIGTKDGSLSIR